MRFTRESDIRILAGLHWAMARKAETLAGIARDHLSQDHDEVPDETLAAYTEDMQDCCRIAKILARP